MSSAATYGSATDDPVHPARESFAPCSNNVHAKKKTGKREKENLSLTQEQCMCERKTEKQEKRVFHPYNNVSVEENGKIVHSGTYVLIAILWFCSHTGL